MLLEGRLHRMQFAALREALDRRHLRAGSLGGQHGATLHRLAVDMHDARAALRRVAADMRAGQTQVLPKEMDQQRPVLHVAAHLAAINNHRYFGHGTSLPLGVS